MKKNLTSVILLIFLVAGSIDQLSAQAPEKLYQNALVKEEGEGNLQEAINLYKQVADNAKADQSLRAKALLHIGMCYEKLGTQEAIKTYQLLVSSFPGQKNEVAAAKDRLSRLKQIVEKVSETPPSPKFRKTLITNQLSPAVRLSPDGKLLACTAENKLWIIPVSGNVNPDLPGKPVQLKTEGINVSISGHSWSGDGKWIAFNGTDSKDEPDTGNIVKSIFIIPSAGGKPKKIIDIYRDAWILNYTISLSPDGRTLAYSSVENKEQYIYVTPVDAVSPKRLTDKQAREPAFSPDGKLIAFVENRNLENKGGNIWIVPASGGIPVLVARANFAASPLWSPDGRIIAFTDRTKKKQLFLVKVPVKGTGPNLPVSIDIPEGLEDMTPLAGWTPDNRIGVLATTKTEIGLYTLPATGGFANILLNGLPVLQPRWSPDGKEIYYVTISSPEEGLGLESVSSAGGNRKSYPLRIGRDVVRQYSNQSGNRISPDGKFIISRVQTPADTMGVLGWVNTKIWKISLDGGESKQITFPQGRIADVCPTISPDGKRIAFTRIGLITDNPVPFDKMSIYVMNSEGGEPVRLSSETSNYLLSPVWSPDGKMIAYLTTEREAPNLSYLRIINMETREDKIVGNAGPNSWTNVELAWSPDSKRIAFNDSEYKVIRIIDIENGKIEDIKTNLADVITYFLDWSRDGQQFVFTGIKGGNYEFWFIENFLPPEKLTQEKKEKYIAESEGIKVGQVWAGSEVDNTGSVSARGEFLSYTNWETGNLMMKNLKTGTGIQLTREATWTKPMQWAEVSLISPDGKQVAYVWRNDRGDNGNYELRVIQTATQKSSSLYLCKKDEYIIPELWSSDNKRLIVHISPGKNFWKLSSIDIATGEVQLLKKNAETPRYPGNLSFSPDNKYLAIEFTDSPETKSYDIFLMSVDSKIESTLIEHPANDRLLGWIPGRNEFLFVSNRSGRWDLWALPVIKGKQSGPLKRIYNDIGELKPMGFTVHGDCFAGLSRTVYHTHILPFNAETGEAIEESGRSLTGSTDWPVWSPDGQYLAFIKENNSAEKAWQLIVRNLSTGEERVYASDLSSIRSPRWSPDGNSILITGVDKTKLHTKDYKGGIYLINVRTGLLTEIINSSNYKYNTRENTVLAFSNVEWTQDGKSIFFIFPGDRLVKHDLVSSEDKVLYKHPAFSPTTLKRSPDGKYLLFGVFDSEDNKQRLLKIPVNGGQEKEVFDSREDLRFALANWAPDGKHVYFMDTKAMNLWRVEAEGGIPVKVWQSKELFQGFSIKPDGTEILLVKPETVEEIRVIENLTGEVEKIYSGND